MRFASVAAFAALCLAGFASAASSTPASARSHALRARGNNNNNNDHEYVDIVEQPERVNTAGQCPPVPSQRPACGRRGATSCACATVWQPMSTPCVLEWVCTHSDVLAATTRRKQQQRVGQPRRRRLQLAMHCPIHRKLPGPGACRQPHIATTCGHSRVEIRVSVSLLAIYVHCLERVMSLHSLLWHKRLPTRCDHRLDRCSQDQSTSSAG